MALVTKSFSDIITFTRASTATYFNSAGVLQSAGNNVPRFDYNPATLAARGLLVEEQRTNFFTNTATAAAATVGTGTVTGPDGALCRTLIPTAGAASFPNITGPIQSFTLSLGQTVDWAMSGWVTAGPVGTITLEPHFSFGVSVGGASFTYAEFQVNTSNWTVRSKSYGSGLSEVSAPTITLFRPGVYRFTWVVRYTQGATARNSVAASMQARNTSGSGTYTADGVSGVQYALLQAETGSFVTSTIPTTTTALTRSADVASVNTLSPWYNQTEGTVYAELQSLSPLTAVQSVALNKYPHVWQIEAGASDSTLWFYGLSSELYIATTFNNIGAVPSGINKIAVALAASGGQSRSSLNGAAAVNRNGTLTGTATGFFLGRDSTAGVNNFLNGYLRRLTYYPRALSGAALQAITTP